MTPVEVWDAIIGEGKGFLVLNTLRQVATFVNPADLRDAIDRIGVQESIGPIIDPTTCRGAWFDSAAQYKKVLRKLAELRETIDEVTTVKRMER